MQTLPPTTPTLFSLPGQMSVLGQDTMTLLIHIDIAIAKCDEMLDRLQPPHTGRIRVEWWASRSEFLPGLSPYPVVWRRSKGGRWGAERLTAKHLPMRAMRSGEFWKTHESTHAVLSRLQDMLELRQRIVDALTKYQITMTQFRRKNGEYLMDVIDELDQELLKVAPREGSPG